MSFPPPVPPADRLATTPLPANHHTDHNDISLALTDIINELGAGPKGAAASVTARLDALPRGVVAYAQVTANQGSIGGTLIDVTGLTATWTAVAARRYRTSCYFNMIGNTTNDIGEVLITTPVPAQRSSAVPPPIDVTYGWSSGCSVVESGLSGSTTRKLMVRRIGGSGLLQLNASSIIPAYILVEDLGLA